MVSNKLWINVSKTVSMLIGSRQKVGGQHLAIAIDTSFCICYQIPWCLY